MAEKGKRTNKVVVNGETILDLTQDTVEPSSLLKGTTAHDKSGAQVTGTYEAPVTSVNRKTGAVVLSASDVGAVGLSGSDNIAGNKVFIGDVIFVNGFKVYSGVDFTEATVTGLSGLLPTVTASDNGKFLRVVNGAWSAATVENANGVSF